MKEFWEVESVFGDDSLLLRPEFPVLALVVAFALVLVAGCSELLLSIVLMLVLRYLLDARPNRLVVHYPK